MIKQFVYLLLLLCVSHIYAQHTISGTFTPVSEFERVLLYKATPTGANYISQSVISEDGKFLISLDSTIQKGIYKIVYAIPPEQNNFDIIYNAKEDIVLSFNNKQGLSFESSLENKLWFSYMKSMSYIHNSIQNYYAEESTDETSFKQLFDTLKTTQLNYEQEAQGTIALDFIKANRPYIPENYEDLTTYVSNVLSSYFDSIDFDNEWLQSSDFLTEKVFAYIFDVIPNAENSFYKKQLVNLNNAYGNSNVEYKASLFSILWQQFIALENDEMGTHIASNYLEKLAQKTNNQDLLNNIIAYQKTAIGAQASNFDITQTQTLYDLNTSEKYLVVFWSSTCGHCLDELPLVQQYLSSVQKEELTVIAFGIESNNIEWEEAIKQFPNFIHVIGLQKWDNPVANDYNINATPSYFLLDSSKKIIAKPYDFEALKKVIVIN
jgi:thiol-disulfide isomerase/thioredoxin